jgi:hypothetical protein
MLKILLCAVLFSAASWRAVAQFEGVIEMKITAAEGGGALKLLISKKAARSEVSMTAEKMTMQIVSLVKFDKPDIIYLLNEKRKSYSEMELGEMKKMAEKMTPSESAYKVQKLGKEKILGYLCEHLLLTNEDGETEIWVSKELIDYETFSKFNQNRSAPTDLEKALKEAGALGMPMKQISSKGTPQETRMEVVKVEKKKLAASVFEIPKDYQKTEGGLMDSVGDMIPEEAKAQMKDQFKNMSPEEKAEMKKALEQMPPEQRKMMENMLKQSEK